MKVMQAYLSVDSISYKVLDSKYDLNKELMNLLKLNPKDREKKLLDKNYSIYKYRQVKESQVKQALEIVNTAYQTLWNGDISLEDDYLMTKKDISNLKKCLDYSKGYVNKRMNSLLIKIMALLDIARAHTGKYNREFFESISEDYEEYINYKQTTYIPTSTAKLICGNGGITDYKTVINVLRAGNAIRLLSPNYWWDRDRNSKTNNSVARAMQLNPKYDIVPGSWNKNAPQLLIESAGAFDHLIDALGKADENKRRCVMDLLFLKPDPALGAMLRVSEKSPLSAVLSSQGTFPYDVRAKLYPEMKEDLRTIRDFMESIGERAASYSYEFQYLTKDQRRIIQAMESGDLFVILKHTIDDYSGRLHTLLTRMKKWSRHQLKLVGGKDIVELDYRSFQPFIFINLLIKNGFSEFTKILDHDVYEAFKLLEEGKELVNSNFIGMDPEVRDSYKKDVMVGLFGTGSKNRKLGKLLCNYLKYELKNTERSYRVNKINAFKHLFNAWTIGTSKTNYLDGMYVPADGYIKSSLPKRLQSAEVDCIFGKDGVVESLRNIGCPFITTIHDAVLVQKGWESKCRVIMKNVIKSKYPTTKINQENIHEC